MSKESFSICENWQRAFSQLKELRPDDRRVVKEGTAFTLKHTHSYTDTNIGYVIPANVRFPGVVINSAQWRENSTESSWEARIYVHIHIYVSTAGGSKRGRRRGGGLHRLREGEAE